MVRGKQVNEYDVILLGSGAAGLLTATLLAKRGLSVLLLKERAFQPSCMREGYQFVPFSSLSEKCLPLSLLNRLARVVGFSFSGASGQEEGTIPVSEDPVKAEIAYQVVLPKSRVDLFRDRSLLEREWKREFPGELKRIERLHDDLGRLVQPLNITELSRGGSEGLFSRLWAFLRKSYFPEPHLDFSAHSREFEKFLQLQMTSWGGFSGDRFPLSLAGHLLKHDDSNRWVSDVDSESVKASLLDHYLETGGKVEEVEGVERVDRGWRKGFALSLQGTSRILRSRFLVLNAPLHRLPGFQGKRGKQLATRSSTVVPRYILVPIFMALRENVVPVGMRDLLVSLADLDKPYEAGNLLLIALSKKGDETAAPRGRRAMVVQSLIPARDWDEDIPVHHQNAVTKHLTELFPFLENYIEFTDWSWGEKNARCWSYPHYFYEATPDFHWRDGIVPRRISKNLYFTGRENFPYLGIEGEILSGLSAAQEILNKYS